MSTPVDTITDLKDRNDKGSKLQPFNPYKNDNLKSYSKNDNSNAWNRNLPNDTDATSNENDKEHTNDDTPDQETDSKNENLNNDSRKPAIEEIRFVRPEAEYLELTPESSVGHIVRKASEYAEKAIINGSIESLRNTNIELNQTGSEQTGDVRMSKSSVQERSNADLEDSLHSSSSNQTIHHIHRNREGERYGSWLDLSACEARVSDVEGFSGETCTEQILRRIFEQFEQPLQKISAECELDDFSEQGALIDVVNADGDIDYRPPIVNSYATSEHDMDPDGCKDSSCQQHKAAPSGEPRTMTEEQLQPEQGCYDHYPQTGYAQYACTHPYQNVGGVMWYSGGEEVMGQNVASIPPHPMMWYPYYAQIGNSYIVNSNGYGPQVMYQGYYNPYGYQYAEVNQVDENDRTNIDGDANTFSSQETHMQEEILADKDLQPDQPQLEAVPIERKLSHISDYDEKPLNNFNHTIQQESERSSSSSEDEEEVNESNKDWADIWDNAYNIELMEIDEDRLYDDVDDFGSIYTESSVDVASLDQSLDQSFEEDQHDQDGQTTEDECSTENTKYLDYSYDDSVELETDIEEREIRLLKRYQDDIGSGKLRPIFNKRHLPTGVSDLKLDQLLYDGTFSKIFKAFLGDTTVAVSIYPRFAKFMDAMGLLKLKSSFVDRVKCCVQCGPDLWILHTFMYLGDLASLLEFDIDREVFGEVHAQFVVAGVFMAVDYLHRHDMVHGNIQPSKVLISDIGYPVLTGFRDIFTVYEEGKLEDNRRQGFSLSYASPERIRNLFDGRTESFSIGCLAYEIITGWTPFDGVTDEETQENILNTGYRPEYDVDLFSFGGEIFIEHCLQRDPGKRFHSGKNLSNIFREEWFSSLDIRGVKKQTEESPLLEVFRLLASGEGLPWEQKTLHYNWGRVMNVVCPSRPSLPRLRPLQQYNQRV